MKHLFILITIASLLSSCGLLNPEEKSQLRISANSVQFGEVVVGTSKDTSVTITNNSRSEFELRRTRTITLWVSIAGDAYQILSDSLGAGENSISLLPGQSVEVKIRCRPRTEGDATGELSISHGADNLRTPVLIPLSASSNDLIPEITGLISEGWTLFKEGRYTEGKTIFLTGDSLARIASRYDSLRGEVLSGAGWTNLHLAEYNAARNSFERSLTQSDISGETRANTRAGLAFAHYHAGAYYPAIYQLQQLLEHRPDYEFRHESRVTAHRLQLLLAQSYYMAGLFEECAAHLKMLYPDEAPFSADPETLLAILQEKLKGGFSKTV